MLYDALGAELPVFGHVPMVLGKDKSRLSKRHGAMSVTAYRDMGFLPEAMINYLIRLGWSCGDQEFFTRKDLIEKFSLEHIGKSAGVFDMDKLLSLNADHIKATAPRALTPHLLPFLKARDYDAEEGHYLDQVILTLNARSKTLDEMAEAARFYYEDIISYDPVAADKFMKSEALEPLTLLVQRMEALSEFTVAGLETVFLSVMEETGLKLGKIAQPVRVALTGKTASPGIFEIMEILGKNRVIVRLNRSITYIADK
jgi:glutamyl-tRNA synthetase